MSGVDVPGVLAEGGWVLWSAQEVRTQAEQVRGQVDIWDAIDDAHNRPCVACGGYLGPSQRWEQVDHANWCDL